jgi:hypothetical protein
VTVRMSFSGAFYGGLNRHSALLKITTIAAHGGPLIRRYAEARRPTQVHLQALGRVSSLGAAIFVAPTPNSSRP